MHATSVAIQYVYAGLQNYSTVEDASAVEYYNKQNNCAMHLLIQVDHCKESE